MRICENFKPVFRHFFFENFKEAGVFFEKRLAYTRRYSYGSVDLLSNNEYKMNGYIFYFLSQCCNDVHCWLHSWPGGSTRNEYFNR